MTFVVIGKDKGDLRRQHRAAHLEHIAAEQAHIVYAGPLIENSAMIGSVFIFDLPDRAALDAYMTGDPYFDPGIFASVEIYESRWMVPEREPGFLAAEAARARAEAG
jgi:hypothetical protein